LFDSSALLVSVLLIGLLLVVGEALRALSAGELFTSRQPRRPLRFDLQALLSAVLLSQLVPALTNLLFGVSLKDGFSEKAVQALVVGHVLTVASLVPLLVTSGKNRLADYGIGLQAWADEVRYGAVGFLASLPPVFVVLLLMSPLRSAETENPLLKLLAQSHSDRVLAEVTFAAVVSGPLMEELIFRVVLQGLLETLIRPWMAILATAILFAGVHGLYDALPLLPLAMILGIVYHVRRSYLAVVTIHALFNMTFLLLTLVTRPV
jgi:membrane protease YdiL (CAAX protease family)